MTIVLKAGLFMLLTSNLSINLNQI